MSNINQYQEICNSLKYGNSPIILFLGAGVNPDIYVKFARNLADKVMEIVPIDEVENIVPIDEVENEIENEEDKEKEKEKVLINKLISIPCSFCHYLESRPDKGCPMLEGISQGCSLYKEQQLMIAKMHIRSFGEYLKSEQPENFYSICKECFETSSESDKILKFFFKTLPDLLTEKEWPQNKPRKPFPFELIFTTNYDNKLDELVKKYVKNCDIINFVPGDDQPGKLELTKIRDSREQDMQDDKKNFVSQNSDDFQSPVLVKIYGSLLDDNDKQAESQFVCTEDQRDDLVNILRSNFPTKLKSKLADTKDNKYKVLLLGYSLNDWDLELIFKHFLDLKLESIPERVRIVSKSRCGYLDEKFWRDPGKVFIEDSLEEFIDKLSDKIKNSN